MLIGCTALRGRAGAVRMDEREEKGEHDHDVRFRGHHG